MSLVAAGKKIANAVRDVKITPKCENMAKSLHFGSYTFLITTVLCIIAHIVMHCYLYGVRNNTPESKEHEQNVLYFWSVAAIAFGVCNIVHAIWFWKSTSELNKCIIPSLLDIYYDDE
ncbi:11k protein [Chelonus insularis]|nr:11k protein [Chelonus insularis]